MIYRGVYSGKKFFKIDKNVLAGHNNLEINFEFKNTEQFLGLKSILNLEIRTLSTNLEINFEFKSTDLKSILNFVKK